MVNKIEDTIIAVMMLGLILSGLLWLYDLIMGVLCK